MKPTGATKEAMGHSPLPWQLVEEPSDYADESAGSHYSIWAANDMTVALTVGDCVPHEQGNAQLIVTAVNERERLREALRLASINIDYLTNWIQNAYGGDSEDVQLGRAYAKRARAALNEVEG